MSNALVVGGTRAVAGQAEMRAAQYVRMSTDYQRYSIENQAAVIAAYAQLHGLQIARTYRDEGQSGLKLKNRAGLIQLLEDVQSGESDFRHILVYDVSRWGRFQDTDESAHYEFICKKAGVKVVYCAEKFDNDGTMMASIMKNIKRVMAAEYSRDLSVKIHTGALRLSSMGFRAAGEVCYGLRRQLVDENQRPKAVMQRGDRKSLVSDHVKVTLGPANEIAVVRSIFQQFVAGACQRDIARDLNRRGIPTKTGRPWNGHGIAWMLKNECYIGNLTYNRTSIKLREKRVQNPPAMWVRCEGCIEPIIERDVFLRAQKIMRDRRVCLSEQETLKRLRITAMRRGKLSPKIIDETVGLPCTATIMQRFGSLREAYRLVGYIPKRDCEYIEARQGWAAVNSKLASELAAQIRGRGGVADVDGGGLTVNGARKISFRVARWVHDGCPGHVPHWSMHRRSILPAGWVIAIRLAEKNKALLDYLLLPTSSVTGPQFRFSERARERLSIESFEDFSALARSLMRRVLNYHVSETSSDLSPKGVNGTAVEHASTTIRRRRRRQPGKRTSTGRKDERRLSRKARKGKPR